MLPRILVIATFGVLVAACSGCSALKDEAEPYRRPYVGIDDFGPERSIATLPVAQWGEVDLGRRKQPNGDFIAEDGTYERLIGSRDSCVYAFKINGKTSRLVSWRLATRGDPRQCE